MWIANIAALVVTFGLALSWLRINDYFAHRGWISGPLSRKIIHIGTGPLFVICWLLFQDGLWSRFLAALVPLAITAQFALVGLGIMRDPAAVAAMSRTGDRREILRGPLFYGIVFVVLTLLYWRNSPIGIVALMVLCGGDGLADVVGKRVKSPSLPWSSRKTWNGSAAMFAGSWIFSVFVIAIFVYFKVLDGSMVHYLPGITIIALVSTLIETLPFRDIDNLTVPLAAVLLGYLVF